MRSGAIHHIELWVPDLVRAVTSFGCLLGELGYEQFHSWSVEQNRLENQDGFEVELVASD